MKKPAPAATAAAENSARGNGQVDSLPLAGNIRELENVIERQVILTQGDTLRFHDLQTRPAKGPPAGVQKPVLTDAEIKSQQRRNLINALETCRGKISGQNGVAELLDLAPTTVASRIRKYRIDTRQFKKG